MQVGTSLAGQAVVKKVEAPVRIDTLLRLGPYALAGLTRPPLPPAPPQSPGCNGFPLLTAPSEPQATPHSSTVCE